MDVTVVWAAIIAIGLLFYVVLDGFDLGIGIVFPLFPDERERDLMMNTVAPVWDGNETWLVLGGAALFGAFPLVYATVLSALYLPLIAMLACLILRGVCFEIRGKASRTKHLWDLAFIGGSTGAAFFQGVSLGAFIQGIPLSNGAFSGEAFGWLTPFTLLTGLGLVATYALLGCCWLVAKTEADLQRRLHRLVWPLTLVLSRGLRLSDAARGACAASHAPVHLGDELRRVGLCRAAGDAVALRHSVFGHVMGSRGARAQSHVHVEGSRRHLADHHGLHDARLLGFSRQGTPWRTSLPLSDAARSRVGAGSSHFGAQAWAARCSWAKRSNC
jgi:hypothetical protein